MSNLTPTPVTDKNGRQTTVHKKPQTAPANNRVAGVSAPVAPLLVADQVYAHNDEYSGTDSNVPTIASGSSITQADAGNWHVANAAEVAIYETYWNAKGDAEDAGKSKKEAELIADNAVRGLGDDIVTKALEEAQIAVGKSYRLSGSGEVIKVTKVEHPGSSTISGEPALRFTATGSDGREFQFLSTKGLGGMENLRTDSSYYKTIESFSAANTGSLGMYMGYPFTDSSVFDIALLAGDADYPSTSYPILTGYGVSVDITTGEVGSKFEFTGVDGTKKEYVVPADKKKQLEGVSLQPLRSKWDRYDPKVL